MTELWNFTFRTPKFHPNYSSDITSAFTFFLEALWYLQEAETSGQEGWNKITT